MPAPWIVILLVLVAIIAGAVYFAAKSSGVRERPGKLPKRERPQSIGAGHSGGIAKRTAGPNINVPVDISPAPAEPNGTGFIASGSPEDWAGDPVLARLVDLGRSDFWILPASQLFKPGDVVKFKARLVQSNGQPVGNVPCVFKRALGNVALTPPVKSDASGIAEAPYTVQQSDMVGDQSDDVPDSGSYIIVCDAGGRRLLKKQMLHDVA